MFAFIKQCLEERRAYLQSEAKPVETEKNMNISKKFLEALTLSFEAKYILGEDIKSTEKENNVKAIEERLAVLYNYVKDISTDPKFDDIVALAAAYHNIGGVYINSMDAKELNFAIICFTKCFELLQQKLLSPKAILTSISALNDMSFVCEKVEKKKYTFTFLNTAMELYLKYTLKEDYPDPVYIASIVDIKEEESNPKIMLDILHCRTLYGLGIKYFLKPGDKHGFVWYMHNLIKSRLSQIISEEGKFQDKISFNIALTLFELSAYFISNGRFAEARNHIVTANYVICRFCEESTERKDSKSNYDYGCATSSMSWGSYGVSLLRFWLNKFLQNKQENFLELNISKLEIESEEKKPTKLLMFSDLEEESLKQVANQITYTCILNITDAKTVFVQTLRHLNKAKDYFTVDVDFKCYIRLTYEISAAYKYLAGFEQHRDKQIKLHKQRVECLENLCEKFRIGIKENRELNNYIKQILYEMVTSCSTVMDLMLEEMYYQPFEDICMETNRFAKLILLHINMYLKH